MMSTASSDLSEASTKLENDPPAPQERIQRAAKIKELTAHAQDVLLFLIAFRVLNALCVRTFFQPDEFFQSLEPAWQLVFGKDSGAWLTWEWQNHLRSAIHPTIFAAVYFLAQELAHLLRLGGVSTADLLIVAPKILQAAFAGVQDFYTWKLAGKVFGSNSSEAWAALALTVVSPWQWFCSTRTFSNGLETMLTVVALYDWPWHWLLEIGADCARDEDGLRRDSTPDEESRPELTKLRQALVRAGVACVLRPTNVLIWIPLSLSVIFKGRELQKFARFPKLGRPILLDFRYPVLRRDTQNESIALIREAAFCGISVVALSLLVDRWFFHAWAFPPLKFLLFNVIQSLSVFYGRNDWHYYLSQGLPLLLTTALPFTVMALARIYFSQSPTSDSTPFERSTLRQMTIACLVLPGVLSLISHKEVRFIYPLLPVLHIVTAPVLTLFFLPAFTYRLPPRSSWLRLPRQAIVKRILLATLLITNAVIAVYTTRTHAPGPLDCLSYLRGQYLNYYTPTSATGSSLLDPNNDTLSIMTVGFLMPCHSTPWRSHLVFPNIKAWALTCEPPLHVSPAQKSTYLDEADQFYASPEAWIRTNMSRNPPRPSPLFVSSNKNARRNIPGLDTDNSPYISPPKSNSPKFRRRPWPDYLLFFQQLEPTMDVLLRGSGYAECWRGWNTAWHDDWRRKGDIVAWCLHPERRIPSYRDQRKMHQTGSGGLWQIGKRAAAGVRSTTDAVWHSITMKPIRNLLPTGGTDRRGSRSGWTSYFPFSSFPSSSSSSSSSSSWRKKAKQKMTKPSKGDEKDLWS